jgi:hypothetical protein
MRRACKDIHPTNEDFLRDVRLGRYEYNFVVSLAQAFEDGEHGCERDRGFAFLLLDALLPEPVPFDVSSDRLGQVLDRTGPNMSLISDRRYREIVSARWLLASSDYSLADQGWSQDQIEQFLLVPANWEFALAHFGQQATRIWREGDFETHEIGSNRDRDRAVFRLLTDPTSPRFDRATAASLARASGDPAHVMTAAQLLLDPSYGAPDVSRVHQLAASLPDPSLKADIVRLLLDPALGEDGLAAAQSLLSGYSPYHHFADADMAAAGTLWQDIARRLAASDDPLVRARGEGILRTGDPRFGPDLLPEVAGDLLLLDRWPEGLPARRFGRAESWAESYPARAIRDEYAGMTGVSVLFGPDGAFEKFWIARSSGSTILDEGAIRSAERYIRPRVKDMRLDGYAGRHVLVRLLDVEWHLGATPDRPLGAQVGDGRVVVVAEPLQRFSDCGTF